MHVFKQKLFSGGLAVCFTLTSIFSPTVAAAAPNIQSTPISTTTTSIFGNDQYETAAKIAQEGWSGTSDYAILAAGMPANLIDALAAGPLAAKLNAPILLTEGNSLTKYAKDELTRLKVKKVYVTSGSAVIKQSVINEVKSLGTVSEVISLGGYDASETSVNIAKEMANQGVKVSKVVLTGGAGSDALSMAPIAGAQGMPILYSNGASLSSYVKAYLDGIKGSLAKSYVIGGTGVISDSVKAQIPGSVERYYGYSQYDTNIAVLKQFAGTMKNKYTYVANGDTLVDALAGAPLAVQNNSLILLTGRTLPEASKKYAQANLSSNVIGLGGEAVVPASVLRSLRPIEIISQDEAIRGSKDAENLEQLKGTLTITGNKVTLKNAATDYSIYIQGDNATLDNVTVKGTIFIDPGENGSATLKNVTATNIVILSGGAHTINLENVIAQLLNNQSSSSNVHINATGGTRIERTESSASAIFEAEDGSFGIIRITYSSQTPGAPPVVELIGNFSDTIEVGGGVTLIADPEANISKIAVVTENPEQTVTLKGKYDSVTVETQANIVLGDKSSVEDMVTKATAKITVPATSSIGRLDKGSTETTTSGSGSVGGSTSPGGGGGGGGGGGDVVLSSIAITTPATKTTYIVGQPLDLSGLVVTGTYSNNTTKALTITAANVSGFNSSAPAASQTLTITVDGKTVSYTITIEAAVLNSIAITTPATKTTYFVGDSLDLTGLVVTGTYNNGTSKAETITDANVSGFDSSVPTLSQTLTITVDGKTATYIISIQPAPVVLNSIAITTPANKQTYTVGDPLDLTGLVVTGTYSDNSTKEETITAANVTGFNSANPAASQTLTITVGGKTTTYIVVINALTAPPAPSSVNATAVSGTKVNVHWSSSVGATSYKVYRDGNPDALATVQGTGYTDSGLDYAHTYSYTVKAVNNVGDSLASASASATTFLRGALIVSGAANGAIINRDVTITAQSQGQKVTIKDNGNTVADNVDNVAAATIQTPGDHNLVITATGGALPVNLSFKIDKEAPTVTLSGVADNAQILNPSAGVTLTAAYAGDFLENTKSVLLDGNPFDITQAIKQPGQHTVTASVRDAAGNVGTASKTFSIVWDSMAPGITLNGAADGSTIANPITPSVTLNGGSNLANYTYTVSITGPDGQKTVYPYGAGIPLLSAQGKYTISVDALNPSYVNVTSQKTIQFWIDTTPPTVTINGVQNNGKYNTSVTPVIIFGDNVASQVLLKDNAQVIITGLNVPYAIGDTISQEGTYSLTVTTHDGAGIPVSHPPVLFTIDKTSPVITVTGVSDGSTYRDSVTMNVVSDEAGTLTVQDEKGNTITPTAGQYVFDGADDQVKSYVVVITAADSTGNTTRKQLSFSIDKQDVTIVINGVSEGQFLRNPATIEFSAYAGQTLVPETDTTATLNGAPFISGTPVTADDDYTLVVSATHLGQPYTKTMTFTMDKTPPTAAITSITKNNAPFTPPLRVKVGDTITINAAISDDSLLSQSFSIDSASGSVSGNIPLTAAGGGSYTGTWTVGGGNYNNLMITVLSIDKAGNSTKIPGAPVIIDNTRPEVTLITTPAVPDGQNGYFKADNMTLQLQAAPGETIYYTFNNAPQVTVTTGSVTLNAQPGHNTLTYHAEDQVGNISDLKTFDFDYDSIEPAMPLVPTPPSPPPGVVVRSKTVNITGIAPSEAMMFGSTVVVRKAGVEIAEAAIAQDGTFSVNGVSLAEGINVLTLTVVDYAGNESPPVMYPLILDTTAPVLAVTKVSDTTYKVTVNEPLSALTAAFNGTAIDPANIVPDASGAYMITTPQPLVGANALFLSASDTAGNLGTGSLTSSYIPQTVAQSNLQVSENASMDIPAGAFSTDTQMTVRSGTFAGDSAYKLLGSSLSFNFSEKPVAPVILKILVGAGLKGVQLFHIAEDGTIGDPITVHATTSAQFNPATMVEDEGYYLSDTGYIWLKTKNFSDYQAVYDDTPPQINFTVKDPVIKINKPGKDGGEMKLQGTVVDLDPAAKITKIEVDGVDSPALLTGRINGKDFNIPLSLTDGTHKVRLTAEDSAENSTTVKKTFIVDATPPEFKKAALEGYASKDGDIYVTNSDSVVLNFTISKEAEIFVNDQSVGKKNGATSLVLDLTSEGNNPFEIKATDSFGNTISRTFTIRKDTMAPSLDIEGVSDGGVYGNPLTIRVTANENLRPAVSIDGVSYDSSFTYADPGMHTLVATVTDAAGNTTTETVIFTVDTSTPTLALSGVTNGGAYTTDQTITVEAGNATQVFVTMMVDNGVPQTVIPTNGIVTVTCTEGQQHTYTIVAVAMKITDDGSIRMANQAVTFKIDRKAPDLTVTAPSQIESGSVQLTGTLDETADVKVYLNSSTTPAASIVGQSAGTFTLSVNNLNMGDNTLTIKATDKALWTKEVTQTLRRVVSVKSITASNGQLVLTFSATGSDSLTQDDFTLSAKVDGADVNLSNVYYAKGILSFSPLAKAAQDQTLVLSLTPSSTTTKLGSVQGSPQTVTIPANSAPAAPNVSADDVNNVIVGITDKMEYSLNGAAYTAYTAANPPVLSGDNEVLVRWAATPVFPAGAAKTLVFKVNPVKPAKPAVTNDDLLNTVAGMAIGMEYKLDTAASYEAYDETTFNALDFSGDHTLLVRIAAVGINPPSDDVTLVFTANQVDKTALLTVIQTAEAKVEADYTPDSWAALQTALAAANTVYTNPSATATEVSEAISSLTGAIAGLVAIDSPAKELFITKLIEVYNNLSAEEKASLNSARAALHDLAVEDSRWEDIISPLLTPEVIARFTAEGEMDSREVAKLAIIQFVKDFSSLNYSADRATLEANLETFRINNRLTFRILLGNDFTMNQLYAFLVETQEVLPDVIAGDISGLIAIFSGSNTVIKNQLVDWAGTAMNQVTSTQSEYAVFADKLTVLGLNADVLVDVQRRLGAVIDPANKAEKAIVMAAVRSQIQCTVPTQIQVGGSTPFDIKIKGIDTGALNIAGYVDWYSSDETVATLDMTSGIPVIQAKKAGTTVISACKLGSTPSGTNEVVHIEVTVIP